VARLAAAGHFVRVPTRVFANAKHLLVLPTVNIVVANVHAPRVLSRLFDSMDVIINLVGIVNEPLLGSDSFRSVHADLTAKIVESAKLLRIRRLLHMSALGADPKEAPSYYLRTKGEGERIIRQAKDHLDFTIFRPSVIFGPRDTLSNRFAGLLSLSLGLMPLARTKTRFAPIFVNDVAEAFLRSLTNRKSYGESYDLCGPQTKTLADIVRLTARAAHLRCLIVPIPDFLARLQALILGLLPGKPFSLDNFRSLTVDSVCKENGCEKLGITPQRIEGILPLYLGPNAPQGRLSRYRGNTH
jgi:NADH dehydrogenase